MKRLSAEFKELKECGLKKLSTDINELKEDYGIRKKQDSYHFAEIAKNEDYKLNLANANRVMITGMW